MPNLAVSDTPLSRQLVQEGRLEINCFETSGPLTEGAVETLASTAVPFLLHNGVWNWSLGDPDAFADPDVLKQTQQRLALTRAPWLSVHIGYSAATVEFVEGAGFKPAAVAPPIARDALLEFVSENVTTLQRAIDIPLLVENLDYAPTGAYEHVCEPTFISDLLEATGAELLLDLAHAQVTASRLGYDVQTFLSKLPLERVRQLHVSALRVEGNVLVDAHLPLREENYVLLDDVLGRTEPWAVTLEYGKDEAALVEQVGRLRQLVRD